MRTFDLIGAGALLAAGIVGSAFALDAKDSRSVVTAAPPASGIAANQQSSLQAFQAGTALLKSGDTDKAVTALRYAAERDLGPDKMVVVLLPDSGTRYLSKVFDDAWMRENCFLESEWVDTPVSAVLERKARRELISVKCSEPVGAVIATMKANDVSQLPVLGERDQLLGLVTEVNLLDYLLRSADKAMYAAKSRGKGCYATAAR